ncbi:MAG: hypothetical protein GX957_07105 [Clostridiaceae bacterium]|nr:hypothetical protein [Clostridiaceae bacterium]
MSIRPVDYQILMPKVNEMAKIQNSDQQKQVGHLQLQAENSIEQADRNIKSVHSRRETEKTVINEKQQERKNNSKPKQEDEEKKQKQKKETISVKKGGIGSNIDIRL